MSRNKPTTQVITLSDESGIEVMVNYTRQWEDQKEGFHGEHDMSGYSYSFNSAEVVIAGEGIDITKQLSIRQVQKILQEIEELEGAEA
jgi:hypothetical protein